jgi:predicted PurR-regulated permease PerM
MSILEMVRRGINVAFAVIGEIIAIGLLAFLIPFYFFFFSVWYPSVVKFGSELIPPDRRERTVDLLKKMDRAVAGFVRGRIVISLIMGVMLAVGWQLVGVQYAIVLGFVIGFFSIVPYLGGVGIPAAIGLLWLGQAGENEGERMAWYMIIFWPCLVFALVQVVETYFLTPVIAGKATNLDPVTILVAVLAGGAIMGVYGMLLAIPLAACIKILFMEVLLPRIKMWSRGDAEDPLPIERD